jgi:hypothetical protein
LYKLKIVYMWRALSSGMWRLPAFRRKIQPPSSGSVNKSSRQPEGSKQQSVSSLKMETERSSEMYVNIYPTTWREKQNSNITCCLLSVSYEAGTDRDSCLVFARRRRFLWSTQPSIQCVLGTFSAEVKGRSVKLAICFHLVARLDIHGAVSTLHHTYCDMYAWGVDVTW